MTATEVDRPAIADSLRTSSFYLFLAGAIVGTIQLFSLRLGFGDGYEMVAIARNIAQHGAFGNPFFVENTGLTAVEPPLYPVFLALLIKILQSPAFVVIAAGVGAICANALTAALLPRLTLLLFRDIRPGIFVAFFWLATARLMPSWETNFTVAGLVVFCLFSASRLDRSRDAALTGVMAGLLVLSNPASILISASWIIFLLFRRRPVFRHAARCSGALLASCFLTIFPWLLRNYHELGAFTLRSGLGMTLYASQNDCAESSLAEDARKGCYQAHHPNHSAAEVRLLRDIGEVAYDRKRIADSFAWIRANPDRFLRLTRDRCREFWFPRPENPAFSAYLIWFCTALSIPGLLMMALRREPAAAFLAAVLAVYPLMYYLVVADVRYRYPVLWLSFLPAGYLARDMHKIRMLLPAWGGLRPRASRTEA